MGSLYQLGSVSHMGSVSQLGSISKLGSLSQFRIVSQLGRFFQIFDPDPSKLFQKTIFGNSVKYSPLCRSAVQVLCHTHKLTMYRTRPDIIFPESEARSTIFANIYNLRLKSDKCLNISSKCMIFKLTIYTCEPCAYIILIGV